MGLIDWTIAAWIGGTALVVLLFALRGRRVDRLPRCKRRRCRYDLVAILGEDRPGRAYPVTCSECGRVMESERDVRWGRRKARKWLLVPSLVVVLACAGVGGFEVYARTTNANPLAWMPVWLLVERAEHDSAQNSYVHRAELLRRAQANQISARTACRLLDRILKWQADQTIPWAGLGDIFAHLAMNNAATQEQVNAFWKGAWHVHVSLPETVAENSAFSPSVYAEWRGMSDDWVYHHMRARRPSNASPFIETANWMFMHEVRSGMNRLQIEIDGMPLEQQFRGPSRARPGFEMRAPLFPMMFPASRLNTPAGPPTLYSPTIGGEWMVYSLVGDAHPLPLAIQHGKQTGDSIQVRVVASMVSKLPPPDATMSWRSLQATAANVSVWEFDEVATLRITPPQPEPDPGKIDALAEWLSDYVEIGAHFPGLIHPVIIRKKPGAPPPPTHGRQIPIEVFMFHYFGSDATLREWRLTEFLLTDDWTKSTCSVRWPGFGDVNRGEPPRDVILRGHRDLVTVAPDFAYWNGEVWLKMPIRHDR